MIAPGPSPCPTMIRPLQNRPEDPMTLPPPPPSRPAPRAARPRTVAVPTALLDDALIPAGAVRLFGLLVAGDRSAQVLADSLDVETAQIATWTRLLAARGYVSVRHAEAVES